jgi:hypothetical protein
MALPMVFSGQDLAVRDLDDVRGGVELLVTEPVRHDGVPLGQASA